MQLQRRSQPAAAAAPEDNWSGVSNRAIRRRVQNRLNQRAYRARQRKDVQSSGAANNIHNLSSLSSPHPQSPLPPSGAITCRLSRDEHFRCTFAPPNVHELMADFETGALHSYLGGSPQTDMLLNLSRMNVLRAAYQNAIALGMTAEWLCQDDTISIFSNHGPYVVPRNQVSIPYSLRPTALQRATPHHPWLDVFPFPCMRDNLIQAGDDLDDDELCHDLTAFWDTRSSNATLLVWGTPWDPKNWEVTEEFAKKWGVFLRGCPEILRSTNSWRVRRGERPLVWERIFASIDI
ncbi:hypothetical protein CBS147343_10414 [Aspergillus niger]|uniref:BZIP domain-containing protein n=1 Tax=Aspergillus niger TaxID=5061 RepID=A0A9W6E3Y2_ASPNG|nr:hypothetical protein CBS133816_3268 [Aspergillus niger]KAI2834812.1 hypothetical protein CBS11350_10436 [Aspergillus niger]KAI2837037.1 hypothetical protein CBS12448_11027 [Aspergillus niger]KAI2920548.1 hypothetical protein CBS147371_3233 [Aspergillus niger]KAI2928455.1 hypothetical protein CBS147320_4389 [Aspergillus niger]